MELDKRMEKSEDLDIANEFKGRAARAIRYRIIKEPQWSLGFG